MLIVDPRHQAITWINVDQSLVRSCGIRLRAISREMFKMHIPDTSMALQWRHNGRDGISNHQSYHYFLNR